MKKRIQNKRRTRRGFTLLELLLALALVVVAIAGDAPEGKQDLTVSHPTFGAHTVKWSLGDDGRPEVRLELLQNN